MKCLEIEFLDSWFGLIFMVFNFNTLNYAKCSTFQKKVNKFYTLPEEFLLKAPVGRTQEAQFKC
jgi:hypothetical protein